MTTQMEMRDAIVEDVSAIATLTNLVSEDPLYIVGTVSQLLAGVDVSPRDIDLLLGANTAAPAFEERVLRSLGYEDIGDFVWSAAGATGNRSGLNISYPNQWHESNIFAAIPEYCFGWNFGFRHWKPVELVSNVSVLIPSPALSLFLKLKSVSDKIYLSCQPHSSERKFWEALLLNDIRCLQQEIIFNSQFYLLEDMLEVLALFPRENQVADQILKAIRFAAEALKGRSARIDDLLETVSRVCRIHFAAISMAVRSPGTIELAGGFSTLFEDAGIRVLGNPVSGAIVAETADDFDLSAWMPSRPFLADVQLNSSCNMKCKHCDYAMTGESMSVDVLQAKLRDLQESGVVQVNFGEASEALLYEYLPVAIRHAAELKLIPNLTTNLAIEPSPELWDAIVAHCGAVAVSIDRFHFSKIQNVSQLGKVASRIRRLVEAGVHVVINTVYDAGDVNGLQPVLQIARELNCASVCIIRRFYDAGSTYRRISLIDFSAITAAVVDPANAGMAIGFHSSDPVSRMLEADRVSNHLTPMTEARHTIYLDAKGVYRPSSFCPPTLDSSYSVKEAWSSEPFQQFRRTTVGGMKLT